MLKAVALGAQGTYIGRPFLYGLGAMGREGVSLALEIIRKELDITMALCGRRSIREVADPYLPKQVCLAANACRP